MTGLWHTVTMAYTHHYNHTQREANASLVLLDI